MTKDQFLTNLQEMLDLPAGTLQGGEKLEDLDGWDSVAMVSFIAMADEHAGVKLSARSFAGCESVADLMKLCHVAN